LLVSLSDQSACFSSSAGVSALDGRPLNGITVGFGSAPDIGLCQADKLVNNLTKSSFNGYYFA
jgi:hypothetical protein